MSVLKRKKPDGSWEPLYGFVPNQVETVTIDEILDFLMEAEYINPVFVAEGAIFVDDDNNIFVF